MDRLASMAAFVKAAESGSFAAAAGALDLSPQMVAKHVASLEQRLGARLLHRTTRRQSLTEIGRLYLERCKLVLAEADAADLLAHEAQGVARGTLRINAPIAFGTYSLMPMVTGFLRQHPQVEIDLTLGDRYVDLIEDGFEAIFRVGKLVDSALMARTLAPYRLVACAAPAYLSQRGTPSDPAGLGVHECLGYSYGSRTPSDAWRFSRDGRDHDIRLRNHLRVNNAEALRMAALDGFGIALAPHDLVRADLAAGRLVRVLPGFATPSRPMHLLFLPDRYKTAKLSRFIDAAARAFGPRAGDDDQ